MRMARECCGWTAWFEMAGLDENGYRIPKPAAAAPGSAIAMVMPGVVGQDCAHPATRTLQKQGACECQE